MSHLALFDKWDARYACLTDVVIPEYLGPVPYDAAYYAVPACGPAHAGITPLDDAKGNVQVCGLFHFHRIGFIEGLRHANARALLPVLPPSSAKGVRRVSRKASDLPFDKGQYSDNPAAFCATLKRCRGTRSRPCYPFGSFVLLWSCQVGIPRHPWTFTG